MLCPKCHRPIEGEEEYICCADAVLKWRCQQCAKVSEGFAFPYGACPHCGGKLEVLSGDEKPDSAALVALRRAFEIEVSGYAFYQRASQQAKDPIIADVFVRLAAMEQEHMVTLSRRYHVEPTHPTGEFRPEVAALYAGVAVKPDDPVALLRIAIAFEEQAASYFADQAVKAPENSAARQAYRELAAEERDHASLLHTELARWTAGKPGLL
jgi:rubrerythrin